jgi:hypothetical protein
MSLAVSLLVAVAGGQFAQSSLNIQQVEFAFRSGLDRPDLLARTEVLAKSSRGADQQKAVFLLGRQQQRRYEKPFSNGSKSADRSILKLAYNQYKTYIDRWGGSRSEWLSDVRFYKAFFFLENNQLDQALNALRDMRPNLDATIYVDDIVWTDKRVYSVMQLYDAGSLRDQLVESIRRHRNDATIDIRVQSVATEVRTWCRNNRYKSTAG